jgi:hypothetical protein
MKGLNDSESFIEALKEIVVDALTPEDTAHSKLTNK